MSERLGSSLVLGVGELLWDLLPDGPRIGGAPANLAAHARALGADGVIASRVGRDALGVELRARLEEAGFSTTYVGEDPSHPTGTVQVDLDGGEPRFTIADDVAWDYIAADERLLDLAARADAICFGTLAQRAPVSRETIARCLDVAKPSCLRVFDVNLRTPSLDRARVIASLEKADVVKMNETELRHVAAVLGLPGHDEAAIETLAAAFGLRVVAVTRGAAGSRLFAGGQHRLHPGFAVQVVDTVGAGDAFTAALIVGLLRHDDLEAVNEFANAVASRTCEKSGGWPAALRGARATA
jgi:fructokinase